VKQIKPINYLRIAIANARGFDKKTWNQRIAWVKTNEDRLEGLASKAKEPLMYKKAVYAYRDVLAGNPTGYAMGLDCTASGLQIMAAMSGDIKTGKNVNIIDTGKREDIYNKVANEMNKLPGVSVTRDEVKYPIMTIFYSSTSKPKEIFGEDTPELEAFYQVLEHELPGPFEMMEDIQGCMAKNAVEYIWELPDEHKVIAKVLGPEDKKIEVEEFDKSTFKHRCYINKPDPRDKCLAANVIHSIDGYIVRELIRRSDFEMYTVHDCFFASPNNMQSVRETFVEILAEIADMDLLGSILTEIRGVKTRYTKLSNNLGSKILDSEYGLS